MAIENKWTWGNVASVVASVSGLIGLIAGIWLWGGQWGTLQERVQNLERIGAQSSLDSRTLIELRTDVAYIKSAIQDIRAYAAASAISIACPDSQPILVASYCRGRPMASE